MKKGDVINRVSFFHFTNPSLLGVGCAYVLAFAKLGFAPASIRLHIFSNGLFSF